MRSEDVTITSIGESDLQAEVFLREPLGDEIIYDLKIGERILRAKVAPTMRLAIGDSVGIAFDPERTHVFDSTSGQAIF